MTAGGTDRTGTTRWPASSLPDSYRIFRRLVTAGAVAIIAGAIGLFLVTVPGDLLRVEADLWVSVRDWRPWPD